MAVDPERGIVLDRPISARLPPRAEAFEIPNLIRTTADLLPEDLQTIRAVDIDGLDQQADGGTHVASTTLVGRVDVVTVENKGRGLATSARPRALTGVVSGNSRYSD